MPKSRIETEIDERIRAFVEELSRMVREVAVESVQAAFGGSVAAASSRGIGAGGRKKARKKARGRAARPGAGKATDAETVYAHLQANPGQRVEQIASALGVDSEGVKAAVRSLVAEGRLKSRGKARGTSYHLGKGGVKKRAAKKKRRKATKRRAARTKSPAVAA